MTGVPVTGVPVAGVPEAGVPETGEPETGEPAVSVSEPLFEPADALSVSSSAVKAPARARNTRSRLSSGATIACRR